MSVLRAGGPARRRRFVISAMAASAAIAMSPTAAASAADDPVEPWAQVTSLQGDFDLRAGDIEVRKTSVSSPAHRLTYPFTDINLIQGGGAESVVNDSLTRLTADNTWWTTLPFTGLSGATSRTDGVLVSVLGNLVYDGSAGSSSSCPTRAEAPTYASAAGIVAGLRMDIGPYAPVWEYDKKAPYLDLGSAGRSVSTPDAVLHIRFESVANPGNDTASAWVLLTVDLRGSLPDYGPVDQRIATVKLATSEVSCVETPATPGTGTPGAGTPGAGAPGVGSPGASPAPVPVDPIPTAPVVVTPVVPVEQPAVAVPTPSAPPTTLAASGSELPLGLAVSAAILAALGVGMLRLRRRA